MTIRFLKSWNGYYEGQIVTNPAGGNSEATLIGLGYAVADLDGPDNGPLPVTAQTDAATGGVSLVAGAAVLTGELQTGEWAVPPSIFRLLLNGTGTVTLDSRDAAGVITASVYSATLSGAVNQIDFPYAGDSAISIRATLTGTATAKVI